jgi:hypothetical protein
MCARTTQKVFVGIWVESRKKRAEPQDLAFPVWTFVKLRTGTGNEVTRNPIPTEQFNER